MRIWSTSTWLALPLKQFRLSVMIDFGTHSYLGSPPMIVASLITTMQDQIQSILT